MNHTVALSEYNKRAKVKLDPKKFALIETMMTFPAEKIQGAFIALTDCEIGIEDINLATLIIDLAKALAPPAVIIRDNGPSNPFQMPRIGDSPYRSTFSGSSALERTGFACDL